jgi:hypothetical protein
LLSNPPLAVTGTPGPPRTGSDENGSGKKRVSFGVKVKMDAILGYARNETNGTDWLNATTAHTQEQWARAQEIWANLQARSALVAMMVSGKFLSVALDSILWVADPQCESWTCAGVHLLVCLGVLALSLKIMNLGGFFNLDWTLRHPLELIGWRPGSRYHRNSCCPKKRPCGCCSFARCCCSGITTMTEGMPVCCSLFCLCVRFLSWIGRRWCPVEEVPVLPAVQPGGGLSLEATQPVAGTAEPPN